MKNNERIIGEKDENDACHTINNDLRINKTYFKLIHFLFLIIDILPSFVLEMDSDMALITISSANVIIWNKTNFHKIIFDDGWIIPFLNSSAINDALS